MHTHFCSECKRREECLNSCLVDDDNTPLTDDFICETCNKEMDEYESWKELKF